MRKDEEEALLDRLQEHAFGYFLKMTDPDNGLAADNTKDGVSASIASNPVNNYVLRNQRHFY